MTLIKGIGDRFLVWDPLQSDSCASVPRGMSVKTSLLKL